jgi:acetyltransferase
VRQNNMGAAECLPRVGADVCARLPGTRTSWATRFSLWQSSSWTMKDASQVVIRPICPEDEPLMVKFHGVLSDRTVYLRYFCSLSLASRTAHQRLVRICFADPERETVLVASHTNPTTREESILGVGRLNKLSPKNEAEAAVLVSDDYQGRGLGSELLRRLIQIARDEKLDRVIAEMLRDNVVMQTVLKKLGFRLRLFDDPRSVRAVLEL